MKVVDPLSARAARGRLASTDCETGMPDAEHLHDRPETAKTPAQPLRIGAVQYLNSKPLIEDLDVLAPRAELVLQVPSRLADLLAAGLLDVALVPSIEVMRHPGLIVVSDACVAARGPVMSVKLYSRVPMEGIRTLALDEGSRTSAALVQILLAQRYRIRPQVESLPLGSTPAQAATDAVLLIGDRAMHASQMTGFSQVWDLGEQWNRQTGLPFVFAMWAARKAAPTAELAGILGRARDRGVERIDAIAEREAPLLGLSVEKARTYLRDHLHFSLGDAERRGLALFRRLLQTYELLPEPIERVVEHRTPIG